jgi:cytoskeleton protein RodZ
VADKLHLLKATVIALEEEDAANLPSRVFTLGYMKNYARIVGVPESRIMELARVDVAEGAEEVRNLQQPHTSQVFRPKGRGGGRLLIKVLAWVMLLVIAGLLVMWLKDTVKLPQIGDMPGLSSLVGDPPKEQQQSAAEEDGESELLPLAIDDMPVVSAADQDPGTTDVSDAEVLMLQPEPAGDSEQRLELPLDLDGGDTAAIDGDAAAGEAAEVDSVQEQGTESDLSTQMSTQSEAETDQAAASPQLPAEAEVAPQTAEEPAPQASGGEITLEFGAVSWVNVSDADQKSVLFGDMQAGTSKTLEGRAPFTFVLGNATHVKLSVDGRPYDITPHIRGGVARFVLGEPAASVD